MFRACARAVEEVITPMTTNVPVANAAKTAVVIFFRIPPLIITENALREVFAAFCAVV